MSLPMVCWIILVLADVMMGFRIGKSGSGDKRRHRQKHDKRPHRPSSLVCVPTPLRAPSVRKKMIA
jgi:hypothetical protein